MAVPLYCIALILGYTASRLTVMYFYGQSGGVYTHYFNTFFIPADAIKSFVVSSGRGDRDHADPHLLRIQRQRRDRSASERRSAGPPARR